MQRLSEPPSPPAPPNLAIGPTPSTPLRWLAETAANEAENVRWVGYLGYDLGRLFEKIPTRRRR